jgi:hypothetical protein
LSARKPGIRYASVEVIVSALITDAAQASGAGEAAAAADSAAEG